MVFKISDGFETNLYTILFVLFFGIGYGAYYATADIKNGKPYNKIFLLSSSLWGRAHGISGVRALFSKRTHIPS